MFIRAQGAVGERWVYALGCHSLGAFLDPQTKLWVTLKGELKPTKGIPNAEKHEALLQLVTKELTDRTRDLDGEQRAEGMASPSESEREPKVDIFGESVEAQNEFTVLSDECGGNLEYQVKQEISAFILCPRIPMETEAEEFKGNRTLVWWQGKASTFPLLAKLARRILAVPASSAPSERLFSHAGNVVTKKRCSLDQARVSDMVLLHDVLPELEKIKTESS